MTKEEKEILLKDLCARLPYNVQGLINNWKCGSYISIRGTIYPHYIEDLQWEMITIKPYLRPLSSMTKEERDELSDYVCERVMSGKDGMEFPPYPTDDRGVPFEWMEHWLDWLNSHHFDYHGLIGKGLALEALENMYK